MKKKDIPEELRIFVALGYDYDENRVVKNQAYADCLFCGSRNKMFVNMATGLWDCKAGRCQVRGNKATFIRLWHKYRLQDQDDSADSQAWENLSQDRMIDVNILKKEELVYDGVYFYIPLRDAKGELYNLKKYNIGGQLRGLPTIETSIFGIEKLLGDLSAGKIVYICEGEWDKIALQWLMDESGISGTVTGIPGASTWKDEWTQYFSNKSVVICYDKDENEAGKKGTKRVYEKLKKTCLKLSFIDWPPELPASFDIRDFVTKGGTWEELIQFISPFPEVVATSIATENVSTLIPEPIPDPLEKLAEFNSRPLFQEVLSVFQKHLHMSEDMTTALRIIFAVVLSTQIDGDPLWLHIVSPPGTAKTQLLMPLSACVLCHFSSTLGANTLVSGFQHAGGGDPSLLPRLHGRTFVLKDFTEVLQMPHMQRDVVYTTLRGAYDGSVNREYGNGLIRNYEVKFNIITGVTHAIFGERGASLGERFLLFHLVKGVGFDSKNAIRAAIQNVGKEATVKGDLHKSVKDFLEVKINVEDLPDLEDSLLDKIISLSELVSMMRANVDKVYLGGQEKITYRPQHEMGTRIGKQLTKLLYGLSLVNNPPSIGELEYKIVARVALDTCIGLNLEAIAHLIESGGSDIENMCEALDIPISTLRDQLDDLSMLDVIRKEKTPNPFGKGAPKYIYHASEKITRCWKEAGLLGDDETLELLREKRKLLKQSRNSGKL